MYALVWSMNRGVLLGDCDLGELKGRTMPPAVVGCGVDDLEGGDAMDWAAAAAAATAAAAAAVACSTRDSACCGVRRASLSAHCTSARGRSPVRSSAAA